MTITLAGRVRGAVETLTPGYFALVMASGILSVGMSLQGHRFLSMLLLLACGAAFLILLGLNLRIGVAAIGPVIGDIRASLGLSATTVSLLTTIPVVVFGAFAFLTPGLTRRLGMHRLLGVVLLVLAAGILLRLQPSMLALFAGTVLVGAAIGWFIARRIRQSAFDWILTILSIAGGLYLLR